MVCQHLRFFLFILLGLYSSLNLRAQISLHHPITMQDSVALQVQLDSMEYYIKTDSTCKHCQALLKLYSTPELCQKYPHLVSLAYQKTIRCYKRNINAASALPIIDELNVVAEQNNSMELKAWVLNLRASAMIENNKSDSVLPMLLKALELFEKTKTLDGLALTCEHLGGTYWIINDREKALYYNKKALEYAEGNKWLKFIMLTNLSVYYTRTQQYDSARFYLNQTIEEQRKIKGVGLGVSYITLLRLDFNAHASNKTLEEDFNNGITWSERFNDIYGLRYAYITYAKFLVQKQQYTRVESLLKKCERYFDNCTNCLDEQVELYSAYAMLYDSTHNFPLAFKYLKQFNAASKELDVAKTQKNIKIAEANFEFDKEQQQMKMEQEQQKAVADEKLKAQRNQKYISFAGIALLFAISLLIYRNLRNQKKAASEITLQKKRVETEHQKSENLLLNILPAQVAEELKATGTSKAQHFDNVTVLFTDFKGFTNISERLTAQQLVDELHACFSAFDKICEKYNIEKIKTVGDAYLAVSGLPLANLNHAENMVKAAIEIRNFMLSRKQQTSTTQPETFEVRIGIHSGSVVAGIVGVKKFSYDIWGDTVNTAARMEQNSEAGRINISETTYNLVKEKFTCEYRGEIEAKNKGKLKMYFVS